MRDTNYYRILGLSATEKPAPAWYEGKELALAFAVAGGLIADLSIGSPLCTMISVSAGFAAGYVLQSMESPTKASNSSVTRTGIAPPGR